MNVTAEKSAMIVKLIKGGILSGWGKYEARGKLERESRPRFGGLVINAREKGVFPILGIPYLPTVMAYREIRFWR